MVTFTIAAANPADAPLPGLALTDTLPDGLVYITKSAQGFEYDPKHKQLTWPAGDLAAGAIITGSFQARVQGLAIGATITNTVTAASPALKAPLTAQASISIVAAADGAGIVTPERGGVLRSRDGRVELRISPGRRGTRNRRC